MSGEAAFVDMTLGIIFPGLFDAKRGPAVHMQLPPLSIRRTIAEFVDAREALDEFGMWTSSRRKHM
jgi:hypothetical protein